MSLETISLKDPVLCKLHDALLHSSTPPTTWSQPPLNRYRQLWSQLLLKDGLVCRQYSPGPAADLLTVPIIPPSYQSVLLNKYHDQPQAGHLGPDKTAARIRQVGYWVGMLQDIDCYCKECIICQASKSSAPQKTYQLGSHEKWLQWISCKFLSHHVTTNISWSFKTILLSGQRQFHSPIKQPTE